MLAQDLKPGDYYEIDGRVEITVLEFPVIEDNWVIALVRFRDGGVEPRRFPFDSPVTYYRPKKDV
jgi:hypothetical protein